MEKAVSKKRINNPRFALTLGEKVFNNCNGLDITERWESYLTRFSISLLTQQRCGLGSNVPPSSLNLIKKIRITDFNLSLLIRQNTFRIECII